VTDPHPAAGQFLDLASRIGAAAYWISRDLEALQRGDTQEQDEIARHISLVTEALADAVNLLEASATRAAEPRVSARRRYACARLVRILGESVGHLTAVAERTAHLELLDGPAVDEERALAEDQAAESYRLAIQGLALAERETLDQGTALQQAETLVRLRAVPATPAAGEKPSPRGRA
jgi:hypothetical protein